MTNIFKANKTIKATDILLKAKEDEDEEEEQEEDGTV